MASTIKADTLQSTTSNVFVLNSAGTEYARFDPVGNMGIGTTPSNFGGTNFQVSNTNIGSIIWSNGTYTGELLASAASEVTVGSRSNHVLRFATNDTERARIDTSGNFKLSSVGTKVLNSSGNPILNQTGGVLQVVQASKTDTFSTTAGANSPATITGLSASITPSSTTSKVLVLVNFGQISASGDSTFAIFMFRNGTKINAGDAAGSRSVGSIAGGVPGGGATWRGFSGSIMFLDSPSSTSAVSYTFSLGGNGSTTIYLNQDGRNTDIAYDSTRTPITINLMEIAG